MNFLRTYLPIFITLVIFNAQLKSQCDQFVILVDNSFSIDATEYAGFSAILNETLSQIGNTCPSNVAYANYGGLEGKELTVVSPFSSPGSVVPTRTYSIPPDGDDLYEAVTQLNDSLTAAGNPLGQDPTCSTHLIIFTDVDGILCRFDVGGSDFDGQSCTLGPGGALPNLGASEFDNSWILHIPPANGGGVDSTTVVTDLMTHYATGIGTYTQIDFTSDPVLIATDLTSTLSCPPLVTPAPVPTVGQWGLINLSIILAIFGLVAILAQQMKGKELTL